MSQIEDDDSKPWTEHDLKEAIRRINAGEINFKEAESYYGISPRTIHRQRAIENMRAQLNPEKAKKLKATATSTKKDITILRKPVEISCSSISDVVSLFNEGTEEMKQLLNYECDLIYECKVCKSLFRSLLNFISHKRIYCCDMFSVVHVQSDENGNATMASNLAKVEEKFKTKETLREFTSRPFRITCRKDLTTVLKKITALPSEFVSADPLLHLQSMENTTYALQQAIIPNPRINEPTAEPSESNTTDKKSAVSEMEPKKEMTPKAQEKSASTTSQEKVKSTLQDSPDEISAPLTKLIPLVPVPVVTSYAKHFKCPVCTKRFSTKKSVLRHLKSIHQKSDEQVQKFKSQIPSLGKKKKILAKTKLNTVPKQTTFTYTPSIPLVKLPPPVPFTLSKESATSPTAITKSDSNLEKGSTYTSHARTCRKNASSDDDTGARTEPSPDPPSPSVSLTRINTLGRVPKSENNITHGKKLAPSTSQKKVAAPPSSSLSAMPSSKKIGIQVRMNYRKDGVNQSTCTAGSTPVGLAVPSGSEHTDSNNSRRSSAASVNHDEHAEGSEADLLKGPNTRSTSKLGQILKSLLDKHGVKDENEDPKSTTTIGRTETKGISVYCEDCKTAYAFNDQRWDLANGTPRTFKCALEDCDFRSNNKNELLSHLSARHLIVSQNTLAGVSSIFIAESSDAGKFCCHKEKSTEQSLESRQRVTTGRNASEHANPVAVKRKLKNESKNRPAKRKVAISLKTEFAPAPTVDFETDNKTAAVVWKNTNNNHKKLVLKKIGETKSGPRARKQMIVDAVALRNVIPNGLQTSPDDAPPFVTVRNMKKQNPLLGEMKVASKLPKMSALVDTAILPLTSDTALDPATMSEENLKKSVMTIIFGKDMPDENIDANIVDNREKSPSSSSTSSESGREKRYGLRAGKPVGSLPKKAISPSLPENNKDDKVLKTQILNKMKSVSR